MIFSHNIYFANVVIYFTFCKFIFIFAMDMTEKVRRNLNSFPSHSENPSAVQHAVEGLSISGRRERGTVSVVNPETSEMVDQDVIYVNGYMIHDKLQFIKLFPKAQSELMRLNSPGISVLCYIFSLLMEAKCKDEVVITDTGFTAFHKSHFPDGGGAVKEGDNQRKMICYRGIVNLLEHELIYRKVGQRAFFINVNKFFNGNRTSLNWINELNKAIREGGFVKPSQVAYKDADLEAEKKVGKKELIKQIRDEAPEF